jgi:NADPH:quinone reductase-like Zn-dependent oxidoreductase
VYPLQDAGEAHRYMESNRNIGKIVLSVGENGN